MHPEKADIASARAKIRFILSSLTRPWGRPDSDTSTAQTEDVGKHSNTAQCRVW
jgi:hypothetical protein